MQDLTLGIPRPDPWNSVFVIAALTATNHTRADDATALQATVTKRLHQPLLNSLLPTIPGNTGRIAVRRLYSLAPREPYAVWDRVALDDDSASVIESIPTEQAPRGNVIRIQF